MRWAWLIVFVTCSLPTQPDRSELPLGVWRWQDETHIAEWLFYASGEYIYRSARLTGEDYHDEYGHYTMDQQHGAVNLSRYATRRRVDAPPTQAYYEYVVSFSWTPGEGVMVVDGKTYTRI